MTTITENENFDPLSALHYSKFLLQEQEEKNLSLKMEIQLMKLKEKKFIEVLDWIKEAFGKEVNPEYGHQFLHEWIDDYLDEIEEDLPF